MMEIQTIGVLTVGFWIISFLCAMMTYAHVRQGEDGNILWVSLLCSLIMAAGFFYFVYSRFGVQ